MHSVPVGALRHWLGSRPIRVLCGGSFPPQAADPLATTTSARATALVGTKPLSRRVETMARGIGQAEDRLDTRATGWRAGASRTVTIPAPGGDRGVARS